jgi:hypothetical protein
MLTALDNRFLEVVIERRPWAIRLVEHTDLFFDAVDFVARTCCQVVGERRQGNGEHGRRVLADRCHSSDTLSRKEKRGKTSCTETRPSLHHQAWQMVTVG